MANIDIEKVIKEMAPKKSDNTILLRAYRTDNVNPEDELPVKMKNERFAFNEHGAIQLLINEIGYDNILKEHEGKTLDEIINDIIKTFEITILEISVHRDSVLKQLSDEDDNINICSPDIEVAEDAPLIIRFDLDGLEFDMNATTYRIETLDLIFDDVNRIIKIEDIKLEKITK